MYTTYLAAIECHVLFKMGSSSTFWTLNDAIQHITSQPYTIFAELEQLLSTLAATSGCLFTTDHVVFYAAQESFLRKSFCFHWISFIFPIFMNEMRRMFFLLLLIHIKCTVHVTFWFGVFLVTLMDVDGISFCLTAISWL